MKSDTLIILAAAGIGLYLVAKMTKSAKAGTTAGSLNMGGNVNGQAAQEVFNSALPGQEGWGWRYFSDGTSIGPDGSYYMGGSKVWSPT